MEIISLLNRSIEDRFKADCVVKTLEKKIEEIVKKKVFEQHKNTRIIRSDNELTLLGVTVFFDVYGLEKSKVDIRLAYIVSESIKLPKNKREQVEKTKKEYGVNGRRLPWNNYNIPLWEELIYQIELEEALSDEISLLVN
jgi:hypothetical protein